MQPQSASARIMGMINGYLVSQALSVAATLGIADLLASGPRAVEELTLETSAQEDALYRLLRALAAVGVFHEDASRRFALTQLGDCLRSDAAEPVGRWAANIGRSYVWAAAGFVLKATDLARRPRRSWSVRRTVRAIGQSSWAAPRPTNSRLPPSHEQMTKSRPTTGQQVGDRSRWISDGSARPPEPRQLLVRRDHARLTVAVRGRRANQLHWPGTTFIRPDRNVIVTWRGRDNTVISCGIRDADNRTLRRDERGNDEMEGICATARRTDHRPEAAQRRGSGRREEIRFGNRCGYVASVIVPTGHSFG